MRLYCLSLVLADERILVAAGLGLKLKTERSFLPHLAIYQPKNNQWKVYPQERLAEALFLLSDKRVLFVDSSAARVWDLEKHTFTETIPFLIARKPWSMKTVLLKDGRLLVIAGNKINYKGAEPVNCYEISRLSFNKT